MNGSEIPSKKEEEKVHKTLEEIKKSLSEDSMSKEELFTWFKEEIHRRDDIITKLKKDNDVLFKTALKAQDTAIQDKVEQE